MQRVGLENFSNNCYLNSIVQIFLHIPEMIEFLGEDYTSENLSINECDGKQTKVVEAFVALYATISSNSKLNYTSPYNLKATMGKIYPTFDVDEECDAQEFYLAFINTLQEGLNRKIESQPIDPNLDMAILSNYKLYICQQRHTIVDRLFLGALGNHVTCASCAHISCSYDIFFNVAISLPVKKKRVRLALFSNDIENRKPTIKELEINIYTETTIVSLFRMLNMPPGANVNGCPSPASISSTNVDTTTNNSNNPSLFLFTLGLSYVRLARQNELVCNVVDYDNSLILGAEFPQGDVGNCFLVRQYINSYGKNNFITMEQLKAQNDFKKKYKSSIVSRIIDKYFHNTSRAQHSPVPPLGSHYVGLPFLIALPNYLKTGKTPFCKWFHHRCMKYLYNIDYISKEINVAFYPFDLIHDAPDFKIIATLRDMTQVIVDSSFELAMLDFTIEIALVWDFYILPKSPSSQMNNSVTSNANLSLASSSEGDTNYATSNSYNNNNNNSNAKNNNTNSDNCGYVMAVPADTPSSTNSTTNKQISCSSFSGPARMTKVQEKNSDPFDILADLQIFRSRNFDCTLEQCIELFFNETIHITNRECSKCNYVGDSVGVVKLAIAPSILTIQLKRFDYQNGGKKTDVFVEIPNNITISPDHIEEESEPIHYRLVGLVCHIGTFSFGHYFTLIDEVGMTDPTLNQQKWIIFDDISVEYITFERFIKYKTWAYVLFFKRVN